MPSLGGAASGAATGASLGSFVPGIGTAVGAGIGGLIGLFAGGKKKTPTTDPNALTLDALMKSVQGNATDLGQKADVLGDQGSDQLAPILKYFKQLAGGDPTALLEATKPERGRVIDQYDTARKAIGEFGPRGGGSTAALAESRFSEANKLSDVTAEARSNAMDKGAQLGTTLTGLGLSADQLQSADLNTVISAILQKQGLDVTKRGQNAAAASGIAEGLGTLLGLYLTRQGGVWGPQAAGS